MPWKSVAILFAVIALSASALAQGPPSPVSATPGSTQPAPLPPLVPPGRAAIGIALEGGGALGLAHIGVLEWFEEHHVPIDRISGTSMGSLVGALYASGATPAQMQALAVSDAFTRVFSLQTPYADASYRRRQDRHEMPQAITVGIRHQPALRNALLADRGVNDFLTVNMAAYNSRDLDYNQTPIPFRCVATDLNTLRPVTFAAGPLPQAVRASISIPGVFSPVQGSNGHYLVDGGILDNLPTDVLRNDLHADTVIAVHLEEAATASPDTGSIVAVLNRAFDAGIQQNVEQGKLLADLVISVPMGSFSSTDYAKAAGLVEAGYQAAEKNRAALLRYALDDQGWKAYVAARESRRRPAPGLLRQVQVKGAGPAAVREVLRDMKPLTGQPVSAQATLDALKTIQSNGEIAATWETFAPPSSAGAAPSQAYGAAGLDSGPDAGILVRLDQDQAGPPFLLIGPEFTAVTSNISRAELALRLVDQNLGSFGSELRANAILGYKTDLSAEYYRLLTPGGFFIEPRIGVLRQPVYIWANQKRVAERFQQNLNAGLEAGRTFTNRLQVSAVWRAEDTRWSLRTGTGGGPYLSGTAQTGLLRVNIDEASGATVSPRGFRLSAAAGALYHAQASSNAPLLNLAFSATHPWKGTNILGFSGEVNSYFRARVAQTYLFTLGGPMRLSASSFDEYRGTDTYLARTGYMHRIAPLPTGLGQGLYAIFGYEAGEIWSPDARAILRQDGSAGLVANTPLGVITVGAAAGDAGHRKLFVTMGRWF
jgi:NTE family protein